VNDLHVRFVDNEEDFHGLRDAWSSLHHKSENDSVFLSWKWLATWWEVFHEADWQLFMFMFHDNEQLVGIAPLWLREESTALGQVRCLRILGAGEPEWEEVVSTQLDVIAAPGYEQNVGRALWKELHARRGLWDSVFLENLLESSVLATHFSEAARADGVPLVRDQIGFDYYVDLPDSWQSYLGSIRNSVRDGIKKNRRRLEKLGNPSFHIVAEEAEIGPSLRELKRLHETRQSVKQRKGAFQSERFLRFHEQVIALGLKDNCAELGFLTIENRNITGWLSYRLKGRVSAYISGFDASEHRVHSLGLTNNSYRLERAISQGCRVFDFLRGAPGSYKLDYGCRTRPMCSLRLFNTSSAGRRNRLMHLAVGLLRRLKRKVTDAPEEL
jgi:CelD/BcsL family acetyltransferase involved in cellulose biosynthesis